MTETTSTARTSNLAATYCNPVYHGYFADPYVLWHQDRYLAYGTGSVLDGRVFEVLESNDLASWRRVGGALESPPPELGSDLWAPEVVAAEGRFYMYYSAGFDDTGHRLRVAIGDTPYGPFVDSGIDLAPAERFAIDPNPFCDADGQWYLFYARDVLDGDRVGTQVAVDRMPTMTSLAGSPRTVVTATADWQLYERGRVIYDAVYDWHTLEGPAVVNHGGRYYCLYSGGSWLNESYAVSWVEATHPLGPWTPPDQPDARLLTTVPGRVRGPGHNSIVTTPGGVDMMVYHAWNEAGTRRQMYIDPLRWTSGGPSTPGPTWTPQILPT